MWIMIAITLTFGPSSLVVKNVGVSQSGTTVFSNARACDRALSGRKWTVREVGNATVMIRCMPLIVAETCSKDCV